MIRRGILSVLLVTLIATIAGWQETAPQAPAAHHGADETVTLPRSLGVAIDAVVRARPDVLTADRGGQRSAKARPRPEFLPAVALVIFAAVSITRVDQPAPGRPSILWRRRRLSLRAPPLLRLS